MVASALHVFPAELLPGLITLDDWGFPVVPAVGVPADLAGEAPGSSAPTSASGRLDT
jgi:hypothetical protein